MNLLPHLGGTIISVFFSPFSILIPNKFILSGNKGIGKSTFAYHLINYILSKNEKDKCDTTNYKINDENRSYRLIKNLSHPNFFLIDVDDGKQQISIDKIRKSFDFINK